METTWSQMEKHGLVCRLLVLASLQWPEDEQIDQAIGLFKEVVDHDGLARALAPALDDDKWARVVRLFGMPGPPLGEPDSATSHAARLTARLKRLDPADLHQVVAICGASKHVRQEACYADVVADLISWANHDPDLRFAAIEDALRTL
ncbi:MAG: hypothetical protein GY778_32290 [bacterium]|nr:hypothetical protein [bacterium]